MATAKSNSFLLGAAAGAAVCSIVFHLYYRLKSRIVRRRAAPRRFGGAIKLKAEAFARYTELHDMVCDVTCNHLVRPLD